MYHLSANAKTGYKNRGDIICEIVLDSKQTIPYSRIQLLGDERVLGPYIITARRFIPRLALACFPSSEADRPYDIVTGAFCARPPNPSCRRRRKRSRQHRRAHAITITGTSGCYASRRRTKTNDRPKHHRPLIIESDSIYS